MTQAYKASLWYVRLGRLLGTTLTDYVRNHIKMVPLTEEPSSFVKQVDNKTSGTYGSYPGDYLFAGEWSFNVFIEQLRKKFESNPIEWDDIFLGVWILTKKVGDNI